MARFDTVSLVLVMAGLSAFKVPSILPRNVGGRETVDIISVAVTNCYR